MTTAIGSTSMMLKESSATNRDNDLSAPAVSVIIPAYRAAGFICAALDSVSAQSFTDYEVIVVNDGSPDTDEVERILERRSERIIYIKQENRGPSAARNAGIMAARGRFVAFLDADDYWAADYLAEQMTFLQSDPTIDLVYADALIIGDTPLSGRTFMETAPSDGEVTFESLLAEKCTVILSGVVARRQPIVDVGLFDERFRYGEDYDLWLRLARRGARLAYQRKVLLYKRRHKDSLSADVTVLFENALNVFEKVEGDGALTESEWAALTERTRRMRAFIHLEQGKRSLSCGEYRAAADEFREANKFYRSWKLRLALLWLRLSPGLLLRVYNFRSQDAKGSKRDSRFYEWGSKERSPLGTTRDADILTAERAESLCRGRDQ